MSILTKPVVSKGTPATFSISKTELAQHPMVTADSYFSNPLNWFRVNAVFKSSVGSQYEIVEFNASQETPTGTFLVSEKARDMFEIQKLQIMDFDGGFLDIPRSSLVASEWDVDISGAYTFEMNYQTRNSINNSTLFTTPETATTTGSSAIWLVGTYGLRITLGGESGATASYTYSLPDAPAGVNQYDVTVDYETGSYLELNMSLGDGHIESMPPRGPFPAGPDRIHTFRTSPTNLSEGGFSFDAISPTGTGWTIRKVTITKV